MSDGVKVCINCGDRFGRDAMAAATGEPHGDWRPCPKPAPVVPLVDCGVGGHMYRPTGAESEANASAAAPSPDLDAEAAPVLGSRILGAGRYVARYGAVARLSMAARAAGLTLHARPSAPAPDTLAALASLVDIIERTGGYMTPADQESMRTARALLAGGGRDGRG